MSAQDNGGPAFPTENARQTGNTTWHYEGMALRDYFYKWASRQLKELHRLGFWRARLSPIGRVLVERAHFLGGFRSANAATPRLRFAGLPRACQPPLALCLIAE